MSDFALSRRGRTPRTATACAASGCWFWPRSEEFDVQITQASDGSFPLADKLVEMAAVGLDGQCSRPARTATPWVS